MVGNAAQPAIQALVVVGVTGIEEDCLVPDDILEERPVRSSRA